MRSGGLFNEHSPPRDQNESTNKAKVIEDCLNPLNLEYAVIKFHHHARLHVVEEDFASLLYCLQENRKRRFG